MVPRATVVHARQLKNLPFLPFGDETVYPMLKTKNTNTAIKFFHIFTCQPDFFNKTACIDVLTRKLRIIAGMHPPVCTFCVRYADAQRK